MASVISFDKYKDVQSQKLKLEEEKAKWTHYPCDSPVVTAFKNLMIAFIESREQKARAQEEERLESERKRPLRACTLTVTFGEYNGCKGFFNRYSKDGKDFCIAFSKHYDKHGPKRGIEIGSEVRIPWKAIVSGETFIQEVVLADYFVDRVESGYIKNCFYFDSSVLDLSAFTRTEARL